MPDLILSRSWAWPRVNTFTVKPIRELIQRYLTGVVIDPFARDSTLATITNDVNPMTTAQYHLDAVDFMALMVQQSRICDVVLLDPPYSARQVAECYRDIGRKVTQQDTQVGPMYNKVKDGIDQLLKPNGIVISCGWNSIGMGKTRGYEPIEIMLVCHGGLHNDTIVTVERRIE